MRALIAALPLALLPALTLAQEEEDYPKLGPDAVSVTEDTAYLRSAEAPDYWAFSPFVKPQFTTSACSIATVTAAINGLTGLPEMASQTVMSQEGLLEITGNADWAALSAEGGDGVTFAQFERFTAEALAALGLSDLAVDSYQPGTVTEATTAQVRDWLIANESSAADAVMIYFNQGVVTGDWDGPHISLIGAYDAAADRVLILEVDQEWYVPYWTPLPVLMEALVKPTSAEHGPLEGEIGGLVRIAPAT